MHTDNHSSKTVEGDSASRPDPVSRQDDSQTQGPDVLSGTGDLDVHSLFEPFRRISPPFDFMEAVKTVFLAIFVLPLRFIFLVLGGALLWLVSLVAMVGMKDKTAYLHRPLPSWRKKLLALMFPLIRAITFVTFGVYHIEMRKLGRDSLSLSREPSPDDGANTSVSNASDVELQNGKEAYVVVANHLGYLDIIVLLSRYRGSFVAKGAIEKVPFIGTIAIALQCMFVREGSSLTTQLVDRVQTTYACHMNRTPKCSGCGSCMNKIIIFPEGTTTNGTAMVPFRTGVFNAGLPVKPVCIQFPYKHFNLSWETIRFRHHLFRTMTQVRNNVVITELPVYVPSEAEKQDAYLFAANVQRHMAEALDQPIVPLNRKHKFLYHSFLLGKVSDPSDVVSRSEKLTADDPVLTRLRDAESTPV